MTNHSFGGGKKREGLEVSWNDNIIMQLKNVLDLQEPDGTKVKFNDFTERLVHFSDAQDAIDKYMALKTTMEKKNFSDNLADSPNSFLDALEGKVKDLISEEESKIHLAARAA